MTVLGVTGWGGSRTFICEYAQAVLADAPVGYWRHESGSLAVDSSGNGNDATTTTDVVEVAGFACAGGAGGYNGSTSFQSIPSDATINNLLFADGHLSCEAIISVDSFAADRMIITKGKGGATGTGWYFYVTTGGHLRIVVAYGVSHGTFRSTDPILTAQDYHVVVEINGIYASGSIYAKLYVNGLLVPITHLSGVGGGYIGDAGEPLILGYLNLNGTTPTSFYDGIEDEIALYDYTLPQKRVEVHAANLGYVITNVAYVNAVVAANPVAYYRQNPNQLYSDYSDNANDCTSTTAVTEAAGQIEGSGSYNGTTSNQVAPGVLATSDLALGSAIISIECLIYVTSLASVRCFASKGRNATEGWNFNVQTDGSIRANTHYSILNLTFACPAATISINTWYHVVIVMQGNSTSVTGVRKMYINSVAQTITHVADPSGVQGSDAAETLALGARRGAGGSLEAFFAGRQESLAVYNRELSSAEVAAHFALTGL